jgi:phosphoribosylanthranilate isomerase
MKGPYREIKICGITRLEDALCAASSGADAVGFIFHKPSPRYIAPEQAKAIMDRLPKGIAKVGVFVNLPAEEVKMTADACRLDLIQLHGDEPPAYCGLFPPGQVIKAISPQTADALTALHRYPVRAFLVDASDAGRYGGTGKRADWGLAAALQKTHPLILAGGLDAQNINAAIESVDPQAVDINSGCEFSPGIKDHDLIRRIIKIIRQKASSRQNVIFGKDTQVKNETTST